MIISLLCRQRDQIIIDGKKEGTDTAYKLRLNLYGTFISTQKISTLKRYFN